MSFDEFWGIYSRKVKKKEARKMWERLSQENKDKALAAIINHAKHWEEKGTEMQYIPHPSSWLNGERWEDQLEETSAKVLFLRSVRK